MVFNAYESAVLRSKLDFPIWIQIKYDVDKSERNTEKYKIMQFLYQYIYIANTIGIEYCDKWIKNMRQQEQYKRAIKNKPKLAYCHLKSSEGQCNINCPFWRCGCQLNGAEERASASLIKKYEPL